MENRELIKQVTALVVSNVELTDDHFYCINIPAYETLIKELFKSRESLIANLIYFNDIYSFYGITVSAKPLSVPANSIYYVIFYKGFEIYIKYSDGTFYSQQRY